MFKDISGGSNVSHASQDEGNIENRPRGSEAQNPSYKPTMELVNFVFELQVLQVTNLPKSVQNSDKIEVLWRRGQGFKNTKAGYVLDGKALISDTITLRAKLNYEPITQTFESKNTQVQLKHVNSGEVIAETDLDLAEHVNLEVSTTIELEDLVPRLQEASDSEEEVDP